MRPSSSRALSRAGICSAILAAVAVRDERGEYEAGEALDLALVNSALQSRAVQRYDLLRLFWMTYFQTAKGNFGPEGSMQQPGEEAFVQPAVVWERGGGEIDASTGVPPMTYPQKKVAPRYIVLGGAAAGGSARADDGPFQERLLAYFGHAGASAAPAVHVFFAFQGMRIRGVSLSTTTGDFERMVRRSGLKPHGYLPGSTHEGSAEILEAMKPSLLEHFERRIFAPAREGRHVHAAFVGYSFGGCSAALAAALLQSLLAGGEHAGLDKQISGTVITFGSPRFGDAQFGRALAGRFSVVNIVNSGAYGEAGEAGRDQREGYKFDPVPFWPADSAPNPGGLYLVQKLGGERQPHVAPVSEQARMEVKGTGSIAPSAFDSSMQFWTKAFTKIIHVSMHSPDGFDCLHRSAAYKGTLEFKLNAQQVSDKIDAHCAPCKNCEGPAEQLASPRGEALSLNRDLMNSALSSAKIDRYDLLRLFWMTYFQTAKGNYGPDKAMQQPGEQPFTQPAVVWERGDGCVPPHTGCDYPPMTKDERILAPRYIVLEGGDGSFEDRLLNYFGHAGAGAGAPAGKVSHVFFAFQGMRIRGVSTSTTIGDFSRMVEKNSLQRHAYLPGSTHQGSAEFLEAIKTSLDRHLERRVFERAKRGERVHAVFVGYSFGGCTAALSAAYMLWASGSALMEEERRRISGTVVTFGSPRCGDDVFGGFLQERLSVTNLVNRGAYGPGDEAGRDPIEGYKYDPVPFWPEGYPSNPGGMLVLQKMGSARAPQLVRVPWETRRLGKGAGPVAPSAFDSSAHFWLSAMNRVVHFGRPSLDGFDCLHRSAAYKGIMEFKLTAQETADKIDQLCAPHS